MKEEENSHLSDHLANERTFLAWIRTAIGVMAFGFVVVKFSLFVKQLAFVVNVKSPPVTGRGYSSAAGIGLVVTGALLTVLAFVRYKATERRISRQEYRPDSRLLTVITAFIFLMGLLLIGYLVENS